MIRKKHPFTSSQTKSLKTLEDQTPSEIFSFFERLKNMSAIQRFGTLAMIQRETVSSHSYNVAILCLLIADYEDTPELNKEVLLRKALFHDFEETLLSDIPHPIKHRFKGGKLGKLLKEIVPELISKEIFKELPEKLKQINIEWTQTAKEGIEGEIVEAADAMDTVITALREINLGNRYFEKVYQVALALLSKHKNFKFVKLFIKEAKEYASNSNQADFVPACAEKFDPDKSESD